MQKNKDCQKKVFCFYKGNPAFYYSSNGDYEIIEIALNSTKYNEHLEKVKEKIKSNSTTIRPHMKDVFDILGSIIAGEKCKYYNKKSDSKTKSEDSFESRFTTDITTFLDSIYKRGPSQFEKDAKSEYQKWLKSRQDYYDVRNKPKQIAYAIKKQKNNYE